MKTIPYASYHKKEKERERTIKRRKYFREYHREHPGRYYKGEYILLSPEEIIIRRKEFGESRMGENNPFYGKHCNNSGENNPNWKGGRTSLRRRIRNSFKYRQWRSDIFTRDDFTCQKCSHRGGELHSHHIKPFVLIFELNDIMTLEQALECSELWDINNGITYCKKCHCLYFKKNKVKRQ